jgi:hypothetical protein
LLWLPLLTRLGLLLLALLLLALLLLALLLLLLLLDARLGGLLRVRLPGDPLLRPLLLRIARLLGLLSLLSFVRYSLGLLGTGLRLLLLRASLLRTRLPLGWTASSFPALRPFLTTLWAFGPGFLFALFFLPAALGLDGHYCTKKRGPE